MGPGSQEEPMQTQSSYSLCSMSNEAFSLSLRNHMSLDSLKVEQNFRAFTIFNSHDFSNMKDHKGFGVAPGCLLRWDLRLLVCPIFNSV